MSRLRQVALDSLFSIYYFRSMQRVLIPATLIALFSWSSLAAQENYWQQFVHYTMNATLLPAENGLVGEQTIHYKNNSPDTLHHFYLHLYPNAFRSSETIRAREAARFFRKLVNRPEDAGYLEIESFRIVHRSGSDGNSLTAFNVNDTILEAELPEPLPPGGELNVELSFYLKVRKFSGRSGYRDTQYDFAQWYPKVCVYDENGWNNEPFHLLGEFYGEFGTFDVTVDVPFEYIVAATGVVADGDPGWNLVKVDTSWSAEQFQKQRAEMRTRLETGSMNGERRVVRFHAENVHDFAWLTCPDFLYETGAWDGIPIHVLYRSHAMNTWSKSVLQRGTRALEWLSTKFGRYPYPQLSITHGLLGGGMEYPMLVMNASASESLILHEVGHIYFFGILANNEWKEAWLDEGFTSFQTRWYMETRYGKWGFDRSAQLRGANWLQKRRPQRTSRESNRDFALSYMNSNYNQPISRVSFKFHEPLSYSVNAYTKGAFFFDMLEYVVGDSLFDQICHVYFDRWSFKHVNEARFKQVCEEVSDMDLGWFFEQWLHDSLTVDYALGDVEKRKSKEGWETEVSVLKKDKGIMPVEVQLTTASGEKLIQRWSGAESVGRVTFHTSDRPAEVLLDPHDRILDKWRLNNGALQLRFLFEYPNLSYSPRDAYLITWRPSAWYNKVDKLRMGGHLRGRYGPTRNAYIGAWFGVDSQEPDVRFNYSNPIPPLGKSTRGTLSIQKMEGRFEVDGHLSLVKATYLTRSPKHRFWVGFNHSRLLGGGERYTLREFDRPDALTLATWEKGIVNKVYFRFATDPRGSRWLSNLNVGFDSVQDDWGSDFSYHALSTELKFWLPSKENGFHLRFYGSRIYNSSNAPIQDLLFADGANPRQRFQRFYLRSRGGLPQSLHYQLPGGANLRGYYNQPIVGKQILAANLQLRRGLSPRALGRLFRSVLGITSVVAFADVAQMELRDSSERVFADAGVGVRFQNILPDNWYTIFTGGRNLTIRLDFPFWVSDPVPGEKAFRFRWVFGFEQVI